MIESKDISVVIQGAVSRETVILIRSIRQYLPEAEIVLSTWKGSIVDGFDYDELILNEDPGAVSAVIDLRRKFNINRQIVSSVNGIKSATRPYILKCRSDMVLIGTDFLKFWDMYPQRDAKYALAEHKIIIPSLYTIKGEFFGDRFHPTPFHISDWCAFGIRQDIENMFDIPLVDMVDFSRYFVYHPRTKEYNCPVVDERYWRFPPEQYLGVCYAKKWEKDLDFPNCLAYENVDFEMAERFLVNNFIVVEPQEGQLILNKGPYYHMSLNPSFYPEYIKSTVYRRNVYEADYKKYCDPLFKVQESVLTALPEKKYVCDVQEEYQKAKQKNSDEYDIAIITPTYRGHFQYIPYYLESFRKYVTDRDKVPIYFTVGGDEYFEFCKLIHPYTDDLQIHVLTLEMILEHFGVKENPNQLLEKYGRFSFQTLKKFYTMLYVSKSQYLVLDSESVWIAPTSMREEFEEFFQAPFVPYSPFALRGENGPAKPATANVEKLLDYTTSRWYIECFSWFYDKRILKKLFDELGGPMEAVKAVYQFENRRNSGGHVGLMEIILYTTYLEKQYSDQYRFIDIYSEVQHVLNEKEFYKCIHDTDVLYRGECGVAEHISRFLTEKNWKVLAELYKRNHFNIIRCETESGEDYELQKKFLAAADIKILAASQDHRFLPSLTGTVVRPDRHREWKKWTVSGFLTQLKSGLKRVMMNIFPAYRVATDTRFKLEAFIGETNSHFAQTSQALEETRRQIKRPQGSSGGPGKPAVGKPVRKMSRPKKRETEGETKT